MEMNYSYFQTEVSKRRRPAITRELIKIRYMGNNSKNVLCLAEGMPNEETFPFTEISLKLYDGSSFTFDENEMRTALQYLPTLGYPPLLKALREFQKRSHAPPMWEKREIIIVSGAQDGISKILEAVVGHGDSILVHDPFYPGIEIVVSPHKAELIPIPQDDFGIIPEVLRDILVERQLSGKKMPKIMYINATGLNPSGIVIPLKRRIEIYKIACEYNFLILDDDPYCFIHYNEEETKSFLSLDTEGRVIRVDSFSKVVSSGLRIGFVTAVAPLLSSIEYHVQSSHLHAPSLSQMMLYKLLMTWGYDGMMDHFMRIRRFYKERRDYIAFLVKKHLNGLVDFTLPSSGFFLWIKVRGVHDTWKMIMQRGISQGIIVTPGISFMADSQKPCNAIRVSFSKVSYEEMNLAMERLARLIKLELESNYELCNGQP